MVDLLTLSHSGVNKTPGEDAHSFLQRQTAVDMNERTPDRESKLISPTVAKIITAMSVRTNQ